MTDFEKVELSVRRSISSVQNDTSLKFRERDRLVGILARLADDIAEIIADSDPAEHFIKR